MATAAKKDDIPLPIAILAVLLVIAFALGQADLGGGGGGRDRGGSSSAKNPCPKGAKRDKVVEVWPTSSGTVRLRCGNSREGYRHIAAKRWKTKKAREMGLKCIGKVLAKGKRTRDDDHVVFTWLYAGKRGAGVRIDALTGNIITAYLVNNKEWEECAKR